MTGVIPAIERNVPIPEKRHPKQGKLKYPWDKMEVGDSLLFGHLPASSVRPQAIRAGRLFGFTFIVRTVEGGVRAWRVK